jgi:hypothetical protein
MAIERNILICRIIVCDSLSVTRAALAVLLSQAVTSEREVQLLTDVLLR